MEQSKPGVFISSTIRDFRDLRGSLKFWLEDSGFDVWLSEYNDMEKSPGANTFNTCFETIRKADFYILLIGDRRGSLYNASQDVSVTQQEYRVAYDGFTKEGHPIPILFVRAQVKDRLEEWQRSNRPEPSPSGFEDAAFTCRLIDEVTRAQHTTAAVQGVGPYPLANWLHTFHDLRDIVDALKVALSLRVDISLQRLLASVQSDLEFTLSALITKGQYRYRQADLEELKQNLATLGFSKEEAGSLADFMDGQEVDVPFPNHWHLSSVIKQLPLDVRDRSPVRLNRQQTIQLSKYLFIGIMQPELMSFRSLREAVASGSFLRYNPEARSFEQTELSIAVAELLRESERYEGTYRMAREVMEQLAQPLTLANRRNQPQFDLDWEQAGIIWAFFHTHVNLFRRAGSLYAYLRGKKQHPLPDSLLPTTPFGATMEEQIQRERASTDDIRQWSEIPNFWNL